LDVNGLIGEFKRAVESLRRFRDSEVVLVHHDDADGVTSAAIVKAAMSRDGFRTTEICLEKLFPEAVKAIHERYAGAPVVYLDIGSPHAELISRYAETLTVIVDHHDAPVFRREGLLNINCEFYGFSGEREASSSTLAYLFAQAFNPGNRDLAALALVGSYEIPGEPQGLNRRVLEEAVSAGEARTSKNKVFVRTADGFVNRGSLSRAITLICSVGYYSGGPAKALELCMSLSRDLLREAGSYENRRRKAFRRLMAALYRGGLKVTGSLQWFSDGGLFSGMGGKVIGSFCSYLSYSRIVKPDRYVIGAMGIPGEIPSLGSLGRDYWKISVRVPRRLAARIEKGEMPPASWMLVKAAESFGGFADGHSVAASGVIPKNGLEAFIECLEKTVVGWPGKGSGLGLDRFL